MRNKCHIRKDGVCLYVTTEVKAESIGKIILLLLNLIIFIGICAIMVSVEEQNIGRSLLGLIIFSILLFYTLGRYTLWNFFGKEIFIINTKTISVQYDYGFFLTALDTKPLNHLSYEYCKMREEKGEETGKLLFYSYNEQELPELIFGLTLPVDKGQTEEIIYSIKELYNDRFVEKFNFPYQSLN
jgi:hypothetical protein